MAVMENVHFDECPSTQEYLLENLEALLAKDGHVIVTTGRQSRGHGRRGRGWDFAEGNMAASFTLRVGRRPSLAAIEVGVLVSDFFRQGFDKDIGLKWPNDLIYRRLKCGGIVMKLVGDIVVCGLGLNLRAVPEGAYRAGYIFGPSSPEPRRTALAIYRYILDARIGPEEVVERFHRKCIHLGRQSVLRGGEGDGHAGVFRGIDADGGALIGEGGRVFYSGSLICP